MLEIRNVTKIYKSKAGNEVKALDNVSVTFPDTGMVFILGKSGSGKSTMLNVIGGLDSCDEGEFIIKGKSSKSFVGSDFDAYRNTFIGFIFQEYNILDDFTVGANIALALELQGKKATSESVNAILGQVDLLDYAKRNPNELSGGQKQRVAIARALVKDPEIIMADEPTGALDSNTGKQIFDTLKALSQTKLVIIVSHDRDFAERYADRIIEMKDGRIDSDVTKREVAATPMSDGILKVNDSMLRIEKGYQLTEKDLALINEYLRNRDSDILISGDDRVNATVRSAAGVSASNTSSVFNATDAEKDVKTKPYNGAETKFIRSSLPLKNAVKMGVSGLNHKKLRLVFTIFLSLIAFALFGFADTLASYNKVVATTNSIIDSGVKNASFSLGVKNDEYRGNEYVTSYYEDVAFNSGDISKLSQKTGIDFTPVFNGSSYIGRAISLTSNMKSSSNISSASAYCGSLFGFAALDAAQLNKLGFSYVGTLPANKGEIAISNLIYDQFKLSGFRNSHFEEDIDAADLDLGTDPATSLLGKTITVSVGHGEFNYKITAVIDTKFDTERYSKFIPSTDQNSGGHQEEPSILDIVLQKELMTTLQFGYHSLGYVTEYDIEEMAKDMEMYHNNSEFLGQRLDWRSTFHFPNGNTFEISRVGGFSLAPMLGNITWLENGKSSLSENEMLISSAAFYNAAPLNINVYPAFESIITASGLTPTNGSAIEQIRLAGIEKYANELIATKRTLIMELHQEYLGQPAADDDALKHFIVVDAIYNTEITDNTEISSHDEIAYNAYKNAIKSLYGIDTDSYSISDPLDFINNFKGYLDRAVSVDNQELILSRTSDFEQLLFDLKSATKGDADYNKVTAEAAKLFLNQNDQAIGELVAQTYITTEIWDNSGNSNVDTLRNYKIVGFFEETDSESRYLVISDTFVRAWEKYRDDNDIWYVNAVPHEQGIYAFVIAPMPEGKAAITKLVELSYTEGEDIRFSLQNQVTNSLDMFNEFIEIGASVFMYIGLGFAVFAALMMMNFISTSISHKRREIGILRAVGARSSDVFKIFFSEAFVIALINYVLATIATVGATIYFNDIVRSEGINVTLLNFGIRQVVVMFLVSVFVAALSSFLPVWSIARRKPVDAIKNN